MIPIFIERGIHFRKLLCFSALKELYIDFSECASTSGNQDSEFDFEGLFSLMKITFQLDSYAEEIACKFLDMCIHHVNVPEDQFQPFCEFLLARMKIRNPSQSDSPFLRMCKRLIIMYMPPVSDTDEVIQLDTSESEEDLESAPSSSTLMCSGDHSDLNVNGGSLSHEFHTITDPNDEVIQLDSSESEEDLGYAPSSSTLICCGDHSDLNVNGGNLFHEFHTIKDPNDVIHLESSDSDECYSYTSSLDLEETYEPAPPFAFMQEMAASVEAASAMLRSMYHRDVIQQSADLVNREHFSGEFDTITEPNVSYDNSKKMKVRHESVVKSSSHDPCTSSSVCTSSISVKRKNQSSDGEFCYKKKKCNIDSKNNSRDTVSSCEETVKISRNTESEVQSVCLKSVVNKEDSSEDDDNFLCVVAEKRRNSF